MYRLKRTYKIELDTGIVYTGKIMFEDASSILLDTIRGEELILNKTKISRAELQEEQKNGTESRK